MQENYEIWFEGVSRQRYPRTILATQTEIIIIGGGIAGITSAYLLSKAGKKVILLEKRKIGEYVTSATTGFLTFTIDTEPQILIKKFGLENAKLILESHKNAIDDIEKIIVNENIDCDFTRCTNYIYANNEKEEKHLKIIAESYNKLGIQAEYKKDYKILFNDFGYIEMPGHAKFHAIKYLTSLAKLAIKYGAIIAEETDALSINKDIKNISVEVKDFGIINAEKVVSATYRPFKETKKLSHTYNMYREYVVEYKLPQNKLISGTYEDTRSPYNYFRIDNQNIFDRLIIGGADNLYALKIDHEIGHNAMRNYANRLFSNFTLEEIRHWSGTMLETNDGLAFIGEFEDENIFYIFGFSGNGMTYSYIAGKILLDKLLSINNPYASIYDLNRKISWWKNIFS